MNCEFCEILERKENLLFENEHLAVAVRDHVLTPGQITIFPRQHHTIMEMVSNKVLEECAVITKKVSAAVFDALGSHGTNILVRNGLGAGQNVPHFSLEVIPRLENDKINLQWEPRQLPEDEMEFVFNTLKEAAADMKIGEEELKKDKKIEMKEKKDQKEPRKDKEDESNKKSYLLKSLERIP